MIPTNPSTQNPERKDWLGRGWAYPVHFDRDTGAVAISEYETDIRQSIIIILGTAKGERVMRPDFGCGIHGLVFDSIDVSLLTRVETTVMQALIKYEARIEVLRVSADATEASNGVLLIELEYRVRRTNQMGNYVYPFYFREGGAAPPQGSRG
jgi:phage baseplate assembly protein W